MFELGLKHNCLALEAFSFSEGMALFFPRFTPQFVISELVFALVWFSLTPQTLSAAGDCVVPAWALRACQFFVLFPEWM